MQPLPDSHTMRQQQPHPAQSRSVMPSLSCCLPLVPQYKYHEDIFDQLLRTPDLDKQLKQGNAPLQWATAAVEAAVADAIDIAYISGTRSHSTSPVSRHGTPAGLVERSNSSPAAANAAAILAGRDSPVQSPMSSTESHDKKILFSDGMDAVDSPSAATAAGSSFDSGCSGNDDEECEVDWTSMLSDEEEGPGAIEGGTCVVHVCVLCWHLCSARYRPWLMHCL